MKKLILTLILTLSTTLIVYATDNVNIEQETINVEEGENTEQLIETVTMYSRGEYEIKSEPNEESVILDTSLKNTSFEVGGLTEDGLWAIIVTCDGFAYMKLEYLSNEIIPEQTYTEDELYIMAHLLAGEAQSQPDDEQRYVGSVVLNRVNSNRFPNTIEGVVFQKGQYACTWDGNYDREPTERNWANAKYLLENGSVLPSNVVWQSSGKQGKGVYLKTKWHYFCY